MLRKILLPALAIAALAGCATDYGYRGGNGDYYYGQPRVEYRYYGGYGGYGYGYDGYYYDRYGRPVYGYPYGGYYGGYYGSPYRYPYWPRRPHGGHDHDNDGDGDNVPPPAQGNDDRNDRKPPWRNLDRLARPRTDDGEDRPRIRPQQAPFAESMPRPRPESFEPRPRSSNSPLGGMIRRASPSGERGRARAESDSGE